MTEAHLHGVSDPMTGSLMRVPGTGNPVGPQACQRTTPIFDGRMRYNLQFAYKRMEQVKADKGYEGPVVVCAVYFVPVAGFVPHRAVDQVSGRASATWRSGWRRSPARACWCRTGSRSRRRSASA